MNNLKLINMNDVEIENVDWLLYPLIPFGKITIVQGDPGEGKTTFALQVAAAATNGEKLFYSDDCNEDGFEPINVIYQTAEDGLGDTIKPRLLAAKADCSKVLVIDDGNIPLTMTDIRLEAAINETQAKLIILDPIQGFLGANVDMHRANEVRPVMKHLSILAENYKCAIILIGHLNKGSFGKATYRGLGSIDLIASARSVLVIGRTKDNPELRVVVQTKNSLAPDSSAYSFRICKETGFEWLGKCEVSADELLSGSAKVTKLQSATDFLREILARGAMTEKEILHQAKEKNFGEKTLRTAKSNLNIVSQKVGGRWYWIM